MRVEAILLANAAMIDENHLLRVEGGAWRFCEYDLFPATVAGNLCGVVEVEHEDFGSVHPIGMRVFDEAGQVDGSSGSMTIDAGSPSVEPSTPRIAFAFPFQTVVREPTVLKASVTSGGTEIGVLSVIVRRSQSSE